MKFAAPNFNSPISRIEFAMVPFGLQFDFMALFCLYAFFFVFVSKVFQDVSNVMSCKLVLKMGLKTQHVCITKQLVIISWFQQILAST